MSDQLSSIFFNFGEMELETPALGLTKRGQSVFNGTKEEIHSEEYKQNDSKQEEERSPKGEVKYEPVTNNPIKFAMASLYNVFGSAWESIKTQTGTGNNDEDEYYTEQDNNLETERVLPQHRPLTVDPYSYMEKKTKADEDELSGSESSDGGEDSEEGDEWEEPKDKNQLKSAMRVKTCTYNPKVHQILFIKRSVKRLKKNTPPYARDLIVSYINSEHHTFQQLTFLSGLLNMICEYGNIFHMSLSDIPRFLLPNDFKNITNVVLDLNLDLVIKEKYKLGDETTTHFEVGLFEETKRQLLNLFERRKNKFNYIGDKLLVHSLQMRICNVKSNFPGTIKIALDANKKSWLKCVSNHQKLRTLKEKNFMDNSSSEDSKLLLDYNEEAVERECEMGGYIYNPLKSDANSKIKFKLENAWYRYLRDLTTKDDYVFGATKLPEDAVPGKAVYRIPKNIQTRVLMATLQDLYETNDTAPTPIPEAVIDSLYGEGDRDFYLLEESDWESLKRFSIDVLEEVDLTKVKIRVSPYHFSKWNQHFTLGNIPSVTTWLDWRNYKKKLIQNEKQRRVDELRKIKDLGGTYVLVGGVHMPIGESHMQEITDNLDEQMDEDIINTRIDINLRMSFVISESNILD